MLQATLLRPTHYVPRVGFLRLVNAVAAFRVSGGGERHRCHSQALQQDGAQVAASTVVYSRAFREATLCGAQSGNGRSCKVSERLHVAPLGAAPAAVRA